jgi:hypothetical protein
MITLDFDNGYEEFEIEVEFDYQPYEAPTREYPGASESVEICEVTKDGKEICLIGDTEIELSEEILGKIYDERNIYDGDY